MNRLLLGIFILWGSLYLFAQTPSSDKLENLFLKSRELINQDPDASKELALNLMKESQDAQNKQMEVKAYYLLAFNAYLSANSTEVNQYLNHGIQLAKTIHYKEGEALCLRLLGTQYARLSMVKKSEEKLNESLKLIEGLNSEEANEIRGMIYNSKLILMDDLKEIPAKISVAKQAIDQFKKLKNLDRQNDLLVSAYTNLGYLYSKNENHDSAQIVLKDALRRNNDKDKYLSAAIYHDIGFSYQNRNLNDSAIFYYQKGLTYTKGSDFSHKRLEIYERLYKIYKETGDLEHYNQYLELYSFLNDSINKNNAQSVESLIVKNEKEKEFVASQNKRFKIITSVAVGLCLLFGFFLWVVWQKRKKQKLKFEEIVQRLDKEKLHPKTTETSSEKNFAILEETEIRILHKLEKFEKSLQFNNPDISLFNLANQINTNTKYLSEIIKKHKGQNFNTYINDLRIQYIIDKLNNDPKYLNYKISHLAEETGFSSHSAFSSIFSQKMGITPSNFIKYLKAKK